MKQIPRWVEQMATVLDEGGVREISPRYLAAIGRVASEWASLEYVLNLHIWVLGALDVDCGAAFTAQITSIASRVGLLVALIQCHDGSQAIQKKVSKFAERLHALAARRNRIVHDPWIKGERSKKTYRIEIDARRNFTFAHKTVKLRDVNKCATDIRATKEEFLLLFTGSLMKDKALVTSLIEKRKKAMP